MDFTRRETLLQLEERTTETWVQFPVAAAAPVARDTDTDERRRNQGRLRPTAVPGAAAVTQATLMWAASDSRRMVSQ